MNDSRRLTRRDFLRLSTLTAAGAVLSGCAPAYNWLAERAEEAVRFGLPPGETPFDFQLLNRLTFGPRTEERWRLVEIGWQAWVEEQLAPEGIDDPVCDLRLRSFTTLTMGANDLYDLSDKLFDDQDRLSVPDELRQSALIRQAYSRRQLFERMVEFWSDHFNISVEKGDCFYLKSVDDREVIRKHALGKFGELLSASAHSPAMLAYLDNQANHKDAPNENYARELLELHSLGVDGGYSQQDVMELARCLTGWTIKEHFWRGDFVFKKENHDDSSKFVLGRLIQPDGQTEVEGILEELSIHPSSARFIALKLARRFISDNPPPDVVESAAKAFLNSKGDIKTVLRVLLLDHASAMQPKYKRPVDFVVSALRMLEAHSNGGPELHTFLGRMGQRYFSWPTPDGYPDRADAWQGNLLPRWQFALALLQNEIPGTSEQDDVMGAEDSPDLRTSVRELSIRLLGAPLSNSDQLADDLAAAGAVNDVEHRRTIVAGLLASDSFQYR
jgi:uncharacterized protein (DUF1800 family)